MGDFQDQLARKYEIILKNFISNNRFRGLNSTKKAKLKQLTVPSAKLSEDLFFDLVRKLQISQLIECGANDAQASKKFLMKLQEYRYSNPTTSSQPFALACEANPLVYKNFQKTNSLVNGLTYINVGLSEKEEIREFYVLERSDVKTSPFGTFKDLNAKKSVAMTVNCMPLDLVLKNYSNDFELVAMWVDVEGWNDKLLRGSYETFKKLNILLLYIEIDESVEDNFTHKFLIELDYILAARDCLSSSLFNGLYVKKSNLRDCLELISEYEFNLSNIKVPYKFFPKISLREFFYKIKSYLLKIPISKFNRLIHVLAFKLGSISSKKLLSKD